MEQKKPRILVLEREPELQELIAHCLEGEVLQLEFCDNGKEALSHILAEEYDGILSEVLLPGLDGLKLLKILRAKKIDIPFAFLTTVPQREVVEEALSLGVQDFLTKPFEEKRLRQVVKKQLLARAQKVT